MCSHKITYKTPTYYKHTRYNKSREFAELNEVIKKSRVKLKLNLLRIISVFFIKKQRLTALNFHFHKFTRSLLLCSQ